MDAHGSTFHDRGTERPGRAGPLRGIRVLDVSTVVAGPLSSTLMADLGAEVLKIELPGEGDHIRQLAPIKDGESLWSKAANRNKRGITLDLRQPEGKALFERLLPDYDVLVENFRPGTLARWGLDMERLTALRPDLIVLRVTGFGQTGPYRERPGFARIFEAMSGWFADRSLAAATEVLRVHDVSFSPIYDIADIFSDPHFNAREMIIPVPDERLGRIRMQNVVPKFSRTPGAVWAAGPDIGQHNDEIFGGELNLSDGERERLRRKNII